MRMRTLPEVIRSVQAEDPGTALTYWALRRMVLTGEIPTVQVGRKRLLDLDRLPEYLTPLPPAVTPIEAGRIRRVGL